MPSDHLTFDLEGLTVVARQVRHLQVKRQNVAHRLPRGKRASWNGNQLLSKATMITKTAFKNSFKDFASKKKADTKGINTL
ncbi:hypothetical protein J2X07_003557 [Fictibacillus barbaricus]|uniref:Uncharacterized protein n=1 Tax=Fictibacillus barbaricus TaxID=182136 RepID=A0ABU1U506_9BACL|nr:hypothetical protein [Fictibacillus barbaricus]